MSNKAIVAVVVLIVLAIALVLPAQINNSGSGGTVTNIATTSPLGGGPITSTGTLTCTTCTTNAAALTSGQLVQGSGGNATAASGVVAANVVLASSPGAGIAHFAGSTQTVTSSAVVGADMTAGTVGATQLASQYSKIRCQTGLGDGLNAMAAGTYLQTFCYNDSGVTWTITRIGCFTDNAGSSTLNATNGAATGLLTGAVTCTAAAGGAAGTQSATTTIANGDIIKFTFVADGTSKQTSWFVSFTQ